MDDRAAKHGEPMRVSCD